MAHEARPDRPIVLFRTGRDGYGWSRNQDGVDGYHWAMNWDCRVPGRAAVSTIAKRDLSGTPFVPNDIIEMNDSNGNPLLVIVGQQATGQAMVDELADQTIASDVDEAKTPYVTAVVYRHDGTTATTEAAFLGRGGASTDDVMVRRKLDGTYSDADANNRADVLAVVSDTLWRAEGHLMKSLTLEADPTVNANWTTAGIPVGTPDFPINKILGLGGSPWVLTGRGVFKYNPAPSTARFENQTEFVTPHPDNGKGGFTDGRGRIYYPMVDGKVLVLTFGSQSSQGPLRFTTFSRDTPSGRIAWMTADGDHVYASIEPGTAIRTQQLGMVVKQDLNGTVTDVTEVTDQKHGTNKQFTSVDTANSDFIAVGADEPFAGVYWDLDTGRTVSGTQAFLVGFTIGSGPSWSTAAGGLQIAVDNTRALIASGLYAFSQASHLFFRSVSPWTKETFDGSSKYWARFTPNADIVGGINAKVRAMYLIPQRPPFDYDGEQTSDISTGYAMSGLFGKILVGTWRGERIIWHDVWSLQAFQRQLLVGRSAGSNSSGERTLWSTAIGSASHIPIGVDALPARAAWPATVSSISRYEDHLLAFTAHDFGLPSHVKSVQRLLILGEFLQADDTFTVYYRWDNGDRWYKHGPVDGGFPVVFGPLEGTGRVLEVIVLLRDASIDAAAPYISWAEIPAGEWEDLGPLADPRGMDIVEPQAV